MRRVPAIFAIILLAFAASAYAQTLPEGTAQPQMDAALQDLSTLYGSPVVRLDQARAICDQEQYVVECAKIGQRHDLFGEERAQEVDAILTGLKDDVVDRMKACGSVDCLVDIATSIARQFSSDNPSLARSVDLTVQKVQEKRDIVEAAKSVGVDIEACQTMDPEIASTELLRACARLAKHEKMQRYIPEEDRGKADTSESTIALKESLAKGELSCGNGTLDGCGNYCLNPSAEARKEGVSAIPQICREIATRFFGQSGVKELERAYESVQQTIEARSGATRSSVFTTIEGATLTDPESIGRYIEAAAQRGDVAAVERGMDFLVSSGFVSPHDRDFALTMVQKVKERGAVDFDQCRINPALCADLVSDEQKGQFAAMGEVERIMRREMASRGISDPSRCSSDASAGNQCIAAAKAALPDIERIAEQSPEVRVVLSDLRQKIRFGEEGQKARARVEAQLGSGERTFLVGDVVIRSVGELDSFCRTNPRECLAQTTHDGLYSRDIAAEKYRYAVDAQFNAEESGRGTNTATFIPSMQGQNQRFSPERREEMMRQFERWLDNPEGMPPIATTEPDSRYMRYPDDTYGRSTSSSRTICPLVAQSPCPAGEYRQESRNEFGCYTQGACIPLNTKTQSDPIDGRSICPSLPTVDSCPAGEEKVVSFSSPECGTYHVCKPGATPATGVKYPYSFASGRVAVSFEEARIYCYESGGSGATLRGDTAECERVFGISVPAIPPEKQCAQYGTGWHSMDSSGNCFSPGMSEYRTPGGSLQQCSQNAVFGCATYTGNQNQPPGGQKEQVWNSRGLRSWIRVDASSARIDTLKAACANVPSQANVWLSGAGSQSSPDFGMPDPDKCRRAAECTSAQYFDGAQCTAGSSSQSCTSNQYWNGTACVSSSSTTTWSGGGGCRAYGGQPACESARCTWYSHYDGTHCDDAAHGSSATSTGTGTTAREGCASAGGTWDSAANYCRMPSTVSGSCSSELISLLGTGCHTMGNAWFNAGMTQYVMPGTQTVKNCATDSISGCSGGSGQPVSGDGCPAGQYRDGTGSCVTAPPSCSGGQYWNGSSCVTSSSGSSCSSGQYWNGSSCVNTSTTDCPSGQYWSGSACVSSSSGTDYSSAQSGCASAGGTWSSSSNYCVMPSSSSGSGSSSCPSGQYWNGSACVSSSSGTDYSSAQSGCASAGGTWDSSAHYCRMPGAYVGGKPLAFLCPQGHGWNGSHCEIASPSRLESYVANALSAFLSLFGL